MTIRPETSADLPELMPFVARHIGWDWFRHTQEYLLDLFGGRNTNQVCSLIARQHGEIVGYCQQRLERFAPSALIQRIAISASDACGCFAVWQR